MFRLVGSAVAIAGVMLISAFGAFDRNLNYHSVDGEVFRIDRKCSFTVTETAGGKTKISSEQNICSMTKDFAELRAQKKREKNIMGSATIGVSFVLPGSDEPQFGSIKLTGSDDAFYELHKGDRVHLLVSKTDPEQVRLN
jgi:hypothetical protein